MGQPQRNEVSLVIWIYYVATIGLLTLFLIILFWVIIMPIFFKTEAQPISPLPSFLSRIENNQVSILDLWKPSFSKIKGSFIVKPEIKAKSALVYDLTTDQVLFEKNEKEKLAIASLTKIMTAIIALENKKENNKYFVSKQSLVGENSMGLSEGEVLSLEELLYGLMLVSANDAAEVFADNYSFGREEFIQAMNKKAKSLGLKNTNFTNPSGLEGDGSQYSTAYDLLVITKYALSNFNLFKKIVSTYEYSIPYTKNHKAFYLQNETNLLTSYSGVRGVKDGYTPEAGLCLITYLEYKGHKIIGVLLGSDDRRGEMKELLDYSLKTLGMFPP